MASPPYPAQPLARILPRQPLAPHPHDRVDEASADDRWPLPHATMFIVVAAASSWMGVIALGRWLLAL